MKPTLFLFGMTLGDVYNPGNSVAIITGGLLTMITGRAFLPEIEKLGVTHLSYAVGYGLLRMLDYEPATALMGGLVLGFLGFSVDLSIQTKKWSRVENLSGRRMSSHSYNTVRKYGPLDQNP